MSNRAEQASIRTEVVVEAPREVEVRFRRVNVTYVVVKGGLGKGGGDAWSKKDSGLIPVRLLPRAAEGSP